MNHYESDTVKPGREGIPQSQYPAHEELLMSYLQDECCVLLADVTGSTALYSSVGDVQALAAISSYIESIKSIIARHNGEFIHSRGDDILSIYLDPTDALAATRDVLKVRSEAGLSLHAGLHFGPVVRTEDDVYGDTVNIAARLSSTANTGEVLISGNFADLEHGKFKEELRFINHVEFKGKDEPTAVYALRPILVNATKTQIGQQTQFNTKLPVTEVGVSVELTLNGKSYLCSDNQSMVLGRADHCDILDPSPWVSREHALLEVKGDKVNLTDRSSGSTYVKFGDGHEVSIVRESIMLTGSGVISLALSTEAPNVKPYPIPSYLWIKIKKGPLGPSEFVVHQMITQPRLPLQILLRPLRLPSALDRLCLSQLHRDRRGSITAMGALSP